MIRKRWLMPAVMSAVLLVAGCSAKESTEVKSELDPENPVNITVWNYYSGDQLECFNRLVDEFNDGKGKELGVVVTSLSQGSLDDLKAAVIAAADKKVGSDDVPNMFPAYTDAAYEMDERGLVQDLSAWFTEEEKAAYVDGYIREGEFSQDGSLKIMPIAKATEIFVLNETDWDRFADATGADKSDLSTMEGLTETAEKYYEWTDSLTEEKDDGKAFFGRDAMANYMLVGAKQLGNEIIGKDTDGNPVITLDEEVARKLWDNYYVPYINGYFAATGRFRSDDLKTGNVIAYVGSSSSATFTPANVTLNDNTSYDIETGVYAAPEFAGAEKVAVQQGAGMVVTKASDQEVEGSVAFLKWFTEAEQNISFAVSAGYLPVRKEANNIEAIEKNGVETKEIVSKMLEVAVETVNSNEMYTPLPVENGSALRTVLDTSLSGKAAADRIAIEAMMDGGKSRGEAVAVFDTDENFEGWYQEMMKLLEGEE